MSSYDMNKCGICGVPWKRPERRPGDAHIPEHLFGDHDTLSPDCPGKPPLVNVTVLNGAVQKVEPAT